MNIQAGGEKPTSGGITLLMENKATGERVKVRGTKSAAGYRVDDTKYTAGSWKPLAWAYTQEDFLERNGQTVRDGNYGGYKYEEEPSETFARRTKKTMYHYRNTLTGEEFWSDNPNINFNERNKNPPKPPSPTTPTWCTVLQVSINVTIEDLKKRWKELNVKYHPDKPGGSLTKCQEINNAYDQACKYIKIKK